MRSISVSTDVFARLWSLRQPGEDTEDAILRRVLWSIPSSVSTIDPHPRSKTGFFDARHRVLFPEGFEVFRTYLGTEYRAVATAGRWVLQGDGRSCRSLNELSRAIGAKTENAWINWFYLDETGVRHPVSDLRDPKTVSSRHKEGAKEDMRYAPRLARSNKRSDSSQIREGRTWLDDVRDALEMLGGRAPLHQIYKQVKEIRKNGGRSVPPSLEATIRRTLEDHSSDSQNYRGGRDVFYMPEGKGAGVWALRRSVRQF